jgi:membrane protein DedA with SNARE-associated domain
VSAHEIHQLLNQYGLGVVFLAAAAQAFGAPVPGTTVLVAAALYAGTSHGLPITGVIAAGVLGVVCGTTAGYGLGRWRGEPVLLWVARRLRQSPARVHHLRREFAEHGAAWVFVGRFITGVRNVTGLLAGASGMRLDRFLAVSTAAALAWAVINALEYYFFGGALAAASTWLQVALICVGLAWMAVSLNLLRRRALRRLQSSVDA